MTGHEEDRMTDALPDGLDPTVRAGVEAMLTAAGARLR